MHKIILNIILSLAANTATAAVTNDIAFIADYDGSTQRYVEILPDGFDPLKTNDVLVCLHGHGSDRWQYVNVVRGETSSARDIARERVMIFISPDYRATTSWMGPAAEADMLQILAALKQHYKVGRVIFSGGSMGASSALTFTALHPDLVDGVVALNGLADHVTYQNFQEAIAASFGGTKTEVPQEYYKRSALYFPERFSMPLAVTAGGLDTTVPPGSVLQLAETVSTNNPLVWIDFDPARGHSTDYAAAYAAYQFLANTGLVANIAAPVNIAHWSFNVDAAGVTDISGNGHTLVNSGVTISNGVAVFNGSQTAFRTLDTLNLAPYTNLTVEFFMRSKSGPAPMILIEHTSQFYSNPGAFVVTYNETNAVGQMMGGFCTAAGTKLNLDTTAGKAADDGQWHHVAIVYDSAKTGVDRSMFYLDGVAQGTYAAWTDGSATTLRNATLFIGSRNNTLSKYIGELDDIRITGAALSTNEFLQSRTEEPRPVVAYWPFYTNFPLSDLSRNGNTLENSGVTFRDGAACFDGAQTVFNTVNTLDLSPYGSLTVECFLKTTASAKMMVLEQTTKFYENPGAFLIDVNESEPSAGDIMGGFCMAAGTKLNLDISAAGAASDGEWHHLALVYDKYAAGSDRVALYLDGIPQQTNGTWTNDMAAAFVNAPFFIGSRNNTTLKLTGQLDDVRITGAVLNPSQFLGQRTCSGGTQFCVQ